jgi:hypothetical protein
MTPEERRLITGLFDRMRNFGVPAKDREAEQLIQQSLREVPDAPYMLVQSVLVQEHALEAANRRVLELEDRVHNLEEGASGRRAESSGSFLGGLFGGASRQTSTGGSVPQVGPRSAPGPGASAAPAYGAGPSPWQTGAPAASGGGGFLRQALSTAAGVAGGMVLADSIRGMLGGGAFGHGIGSAWGAGPGQGASDAAQDAEQDRQLANDERQDAEQDRQLADDQRQDAEQDQQFEDESQDDAQDQADDDFGSGDDGSSDT